MTTSSLMNPLLTANATMSTNQPKKGGGTWFEAMAEAWGQALDNQAAKIEDQSAALRGGDDSPSRITELTTQSLKMSFMSNSSHTSITSVSSGLETMSRKQ